MSRNNTSHAAELAPALASATETESLRRRRRVLEALESLSGRATVDALVDELLSAGRDAVDGDAETVRIRLHHADLPRLADAGLITYDADRRRVRRLD